MVRSASVAGDHAFRVETVIVALDGSEAAEVALPAAVGEARAHGAPLVLIRVIPVPTLPAAQPSHGPTPPHDEPDADEVASHEQSVRSYLTAIVRRMAPDLKTELICQSGDPYTSILAEVRRHPAPLLVMTSHATAILPLGSHSELARRLQAEGVAPLLLIPPART
jgi:nucleotide-binding universal stress UspA family protein